MNQLDMDFVVGFVYTIIFIDFVDFFIVAICVSLQLSFNICLFLSIQFFAVFSVVQSVRGDT